MGAPRICQGEPTASSWCKVHPFDKTGPYPHRFMILRDALIPPRRLLQLFHLHVARRGVGVRVVAS